MPTPSLRRRLLPALALALAMSASVAVHPASARPHYLACELDDGSQWMVVIDNFGGVPEAVRHCIDDLNGHPVGVSR